MARDEYELVDIQKDDEEDDIINQSLSNFTMSVNAWLMNECGRLQLTEQCILRSYLHSILKLTLFLVVRY
jgi:hypothetical protein